MEPYWPDDQTWQRVAPGEAGLDAPALDEPPGCVVRVQPGRPQRPVRLCRGDSSRRQRRLQIDSGNENPHHSDGGGSIENRRGILIE